MTVPPRQNVSPLNYRTAIVEPSTGVPTLQFIQLLQKLVGNVDGADFDAAALQAQIDALDLDVTAVEGDITTIQGDITTIQGDITTIQGDIVDLQASAVPPGGSTGEVLTKNSGTDYDMSWQPGGSGGGSIYAPMVTGGLPGPELLATADGQCILALI